MSFVKEMTRDQLMIPIPESAQWVKDELEAHRLKRHFLEQMNWSFCGVYNSELEDELPNSWEGKMTKLLPHWRTTSLPFLEKDGPIQMPKQDKPWVELIETGTELEFIPIQVPM